MKRKFFALATAALMVTAGYAQQNVGIGTTTPNASAALDVSSNNKGILIPRLDSAQRVAISNPAEGLMVYQKDGTKGFYYYNGTAWTIVGGNTSTGGGTQGANPTYNTAVLSGTGTTFDFSSNTSSTVFVIDRSATTVATAINVKLPDASNYPVGTMIMLATVHSGPTTGSFSYNLWIPGCTELLANSAGNINPSSNYTATGSGVYRRFITAGSKWYLVGL